MQACGPGVERLAEEVLQRFPDARFAVFSSDTVASPASAETFVRSVTDGEVDIIIGTQMAAKGHHFPNLTLVGIVDADLGLAGGDLRAAERSFQMLAQVAGRAGRASRPGLAMLQTLDSTSPVMEALLSGDRDRFLGAEAESRRLAVMPPFARLASLVLSAPDPQRLQMAMQALAAGRPHYHGVDIFGPSLAPLAFLRGATGAGPLSGPTGQSISRRLFPPGLTRCHCPPASGCRLISTLTAFSRRRGKRHQIVRQNRRLRRLPFRHGYDSHHTGANRCRYWPAAACAIVKISC